MANVTVFPNTSRVAGSYISPSVTYSGAAGTIFAQVISTTWATDDPNNPPTFTGEFSYDSGTTWTPAGFPPWSPIPNTFGKGGALPAEQIQVGDAQGSRLARVTLTLTATMSVGLTGSIT